MKILSFSNEKQTKEFAKAQLELEEFLKKNPQLQGLQDYIDQELDKAGNDPSKRAKVLERLANQQREKLRKQFMKLDEMIRDLKEKLSKL